MAIVHLDAIKVGSIQDVLHNVTSLIVNFVRAIIMSVQNVMMDFMLKANRHVCPVREIVRWEWHVIKSTVRAMGVLTAKQVNFARKAVILGVKHAISLTAHYVLYANQDISVIRVRQTAAWAVGLSIEPDPVLKRTVSAN